MTAPRGATPEISVIIPVYNGADFLDETLQSLKAQCMERFEVLCVDDCSSDSSAEIIGTYAARDPRFKYLCTAENLGTAAKVMNYAAVHAKGDYFVYSSQDDLFSPDWLQKMYDRARVTEADAVLPDVEFFYAGRSNNRRVTGFNGDHSAVLSGRQAFQHSLDWSISGNALWRIRFLRSIGFSDFDTFSDEYTVRKFFLHCNKVAFCNSVFFYRQDNAQAVTKKASPKLLDQPGNDLRVWHLIKENNFDLEVQGAFAFKTLRSLIRARALVYRTPELKGYESKIVTDFDALQTPSFAAALATGLRNQTGPLRAAVYEQAYRSMAWLNSVAWLSACLAAAKSKRTRKR